MSTDKLSRENIVEYLAGIELLSLDTDGVLTDGGIYFNDAGEEVRKFNVKDGMGIKLAQAKGRDGMDAEGGEQWQRSLPILVW